MVKPRKIRKMIGSFIRRLPNIGARIFSTKAVPPPPSTPSHPLPKALPYPCTKKSMEAAMSSAIMGGLNYKSYRELIREGQEMQLKTTINLISLMDSLQSPIRLDVQPPEKDPEILEDICRLTTSIYQASTAVLGKVAPGDRAVCVQELNVPALIPRLLADPSILDRVRCHRNEEVVWTSRYNSQLGLLIYSGKRVVTSSPGRWIEYYYTFTFKYPFPFSNDRMIATLSNLVNCFRSEFDSGPWQRATRNQLREIEAIMDETDCIPPEPAARA